MCIHTLSYIKFYFVFNFFNAGIILADNFGVTTHSSRVIAEKRRFFLANTHTYTNSSPLGIPSPVCVLSGVFSCVAAFWTSKGRVNEPRSWGSLKHSCSEEPVSMRESDFEAPLVLGRNKEPARAAFFAFESRDAALRARKESSTRFVSLNKRSSPLLWPSS